MNDDKGNFINILQNLSNEFENQNFEKRKFLNDYIKDFFGILTLILAYIWTLDKVISNNIIIYVTTSIIALLYIVSSVYVHKNFDKINGQRKAEFLYKKSEQLLEEGKKNELNELLNFYKTSSNITVSITDNTINSSTKRIIVIKAYKFNETFEYTF